MFRRHIATLSAVTFAALGLALAVSVADPTATQAGAGCHMPDGSVYTEGTATVVRMDVCSFSPTVTRVPVGAKVRFLNTAGIDHVVAGRSQTWASEMLTPGDEFSQTFMSAGIYPFSCPLHPGMVGAVIVGDGEQAAAAVTPVQADAAPASMAATADQAGSAPIVPAALGAAGGGLIGLLVGLIVSRRRATGSTTDTVRATPALDG